MKHGRLEGNVVADGDDEGRKVVPVHAGLGDKGVEVQVSPTTGYANFKSMIGTG